MQSLFLSVSFWLVKIFIFNKLYSMNWANVDMDSSESDKKQESDNDVPDDWGDDNENLVDDWQDAPDPEEVARKKKEEEERIEREKKEAAEAEKKRKQEIREQKLKMKKLLEAGDDGFDDDLFGDVEVTKEQKEIADLHNALDALGGIDMNTTDPNKIDIGLYKPETVDQFNAFAVAIEKKLNQIFPEIEQNGLKKKEFEQLKTAQENNKVMMIEYLITALCDNYKSAFLVELKNYVDDLYNKKLEEAKKGQGHKRKGKPQTGSFFNANKDQFDNDFDDIM